MSNFFLKTPTASIKQFTGKRETSDALLVYEKVTMKLNFNGKEAARWAELKRCFPTCKSNEEFVMKLLDIAEEYLLSKPERMAELQHSEAADAVQPSSGVLQEFPSANITTKPPEITKISKRKSKKVDSNAHLASSDNVDREDENCDSKVAPKTLTCRYCDSKHSHYQCPVNEPVDQIADASSNWDSEEDNFAQLSLPNFLQLTSTGVVTTVFIKPFTQFGPLIGKSIKEVEIHDDCNMRHIWELQLESGNVYVSTEDQGSSNWISLVRPAPTREARNLTVTLSQNKLFMVSIKPLNVGDELLYWQDTFASINRKKVEKTVCGGCNMTFEHPLYYRVHCSLFHDMRYSLTIRKYHCKVCGAAILGKENIRKHATEQHDGKGAYQCQYCKKFFLRLNYLEMHRTYGCSSNPLRSVSLCDFCGRKFCQPQKLRIHIKRMHSNLTEVLKDFQCSKCLKILGSRAALQRHQKEVHEKQVDDTYSCKMCGKHFQNKSNLKIHMLTHSGIKPFKCIVDQCSAAFTTKQCLQLHYKKVHNFDEKSMPKIERSVSYTFQAYSGVDKSELLQNVDDDDDDDNNKTDESEKLSDDVFETTPPSPESDHAPSPPPDTALSLSHSFNALDQLTKGVKMISKGSKKWIGADDEDTPKALENARSKDNKFSSIQAEFSGRETSNASLLVEAALDSVCNETSSIDIDVEVSHNCSDTLVNNIYNLSENGGLPEVAYNIQESQDIDLISPDHISVTDSEAARNLDINYSEQFSPKEAESRYSREAEGEGYAPPSPRRYADFVENINPEHLSSDESVLEGDKHVQAEQSATMQRRSSSFRMYDYFKRECHPSEPHLPDPEMPELGGDKDDKDKYDQELAAAFRNRFEIDLDIRVRHYENNFESELNRQRPSYGNLCPPTGDLNRPSPDTRTDLVDTSEFRPDTAARHFEPLALNSSDLQGLDMSTRSFHNYQPNINRYHHVYPELDRMDLRLNYTPPPPFDLVRVVSLDLTPPGRHSVDLSLRSIPLHQITNSRLLSEHSLTNKHRIFDQARLLAGDLSSRLGDSLGSNLNGPNDQPTLMSDDSRLLQDHQRLMEAPRPPLLGDPHLLSTGSVPAPPSLSAFGSYGGVSQPPYHSSAMDPRSHVTSPVNGGYHHPYSSYYP